MGKLEGKVAVITGGSSGIGLATAQRFVDEGADVFITGRRKSELDAAVKQIGKNITAVQGDTSNISDLDRLYDMIEQKARRLDILFANAGVGEIAPLGQITEGQFDKTFGINVKGKLLLCRSYCHCCLRRLHRNDCVDGLHPRYAWLLSLRRTKQHCGRSRGLGRST